MLYKLLKRWNKKRLKELLPPPVQVSHGEYSMILSAHDEKGRPNSDLLKLSLKAIQSAAEIDLSFMEYEIANLWPGEHYKLLAGFVQTLKPEVVIEIGTAAGLSARAMLPFFSGKLVTFDVQKLQELNHDRLEQVIDDLSKPAVFEKYLPIIERASFIFIDAAHDGLLEKTLLERLAGCKFQNPPILFFDDIRVWTMLKMWREIPFPKLDLTSFGHWSGSGVVQLDRAPLGLVNLDSARQGEIEALRSERRGPSPSGKGEEEDRFGKVAASPNSPNRGARYSV